MGLKAGRRCLVISHLMYADDLLLKGNAIRNQMECLNNFPTLFCQRSGQRISTEKSRILFSKNTLTSIKMELMNLFGFKETNDLGKYIGVPLTGKTPKNKYFRYLMENVKSKLRN